MKTLLKIASEAAEIKQSDSLAVPGLNSEDKLK